MREASTVLDDTISLCDDVTPESRATTASMPVPTSGASVRSNGTACRCMFDAHQRAVRVVVLEERNQRRRDGYQLVRRDVHQRRHCSGGTIIIAVGLHAI